MLLVTFAVACWALMRAARRRRRRVGVDPADAAELESIGRALLLEHHGRTAAHLAASVETLRARRVPVRRVRSGSGVRGQAYLVFADGTTLLARARPPADMVTLAMAAQSRRVLVTQWGDSGLDIQARLDCGGEQVLISVVAVDGDALSSGS